MSIRNDDEEALKDTYKHIELHDKSSDSNIIDSGPSNTAVEGFHPCVSFDTVPCVVGSGSLEHPSVEFPGVQLPPEFSLDDLRKDEAIARRLAGTHHDYFSPAGPSSHSARFSHRSLADSFKTSENGKIVRVDYPSEPAVFNDALVLTRSIRQWYKLWGEKKKSIFTKLDEKTKWFQYPAILFPHKNPNSPIMSSDGFTLLAREEKRKEKIVNSELGHLLTPRTILCHISGRKHTWVALDWSVRQLAQNTDHIVVIANLPKFSSASSNEGTSRPKLGVSGLCQRSLSVGPNDWENEIIHRNFLEWTSGYNKNDVERKISDIFRYLRVILPPSLVIKITVEIVVGKTKKIMLDAVNCYTPDFCVASTLKWKTTDDLVAWKSKYLKDILCTKFPIPVFVVPAKRMYDFEAEMEKACLPKVTVTSTSSPTGEISSRTSAAHNNSESKDPTNFILPEVTMTNINDASSTAETLGKMSITSNNLESGDLVGFPRPQLTRTNTSGAPSTTEALSKMSTTSNSFESGDRVGFIRPQVITTNTSGTPSTREALSKTSTTSNNFESRDPIGSTQSITDRSETSNGDYEETASRNDDKLTIKEKLQLARQRHRKIIMEKVKNVESNDKLNCYQKRLGVLDGIIAGTLLFSEELRIISKEGFKGADNEEIHYWEQIITASAQVAPNSKRSMLDVLDAPRAANPRHHHHHHHQQQRSTSHTRKSRSGQIKFASNVNSKDGNKALGNSRGKNSLDVRRPSLGPHSYSHDHVGHVGEARNDTALRKVNSGDGTARIPLRKVVSANSVRRVKSNESYRLSPVSSGSRNHHSKKHLENASGNGNGHHNSLWSEGAGGLLSFLKPTSSRSSSRSRHNSDSDSSERGSVKSHHEGRKKKSFFGW